MPTELENQEGQEGLEKTLDDLGKEIIKELPEGDIDPDAERGEGGGNESKPPKEEKPEPEKGATAPKADPDADLEKELAKYLDQPVPVKVVKKLRARIAELKKGSTDWEGKSKVWSESEGKYKTQLEEAGKQLQSAYKIAEAAQKYPFLDKAIFSLVTKGTMDINELATAVNDLVKNGGLPKDVKSETLALPPEEKRRIDELQARLDERENREKQAEYKAGFREEVEKIRNDEKFKNFSQGLSKEQMKGIWGEIFDITESKAIAYDMAIKAGIKTAQPPSLSAEAQKVIKNRLAYKEAILAAQSKGIRRGQDGFVPRGTGPAGEEETPMPDADLDSPEMRKFLYGEVERYGREKAGRG